MAERLLTESRALAIYLEQILVPSTRKLGFLYDHIIPSRGLLTPSTTLQTLVLHSGLVVVSIYLRRRAPLVSFGVLFFYAGHLLESSIMPLELMFEHRNYLPALGVVLATVGALHHLLAPRMLLPILLVYGGMQSIVTWQYADHWSSESRLAAYLAQVRPTSPQMIAMAADEQARIGLFEEASSLARSADSLTGDLQVLVITCAHTGALPEDAFRIADRISSEPIGNHPLDYLFRLANLGLDDKCGFDNEAFLHLLDEIIARPFTDLHSKPETMMYKAHYQRRVHGTDVAIATLEQIQLHAPAYPVPMLLATEWSLDDGNVQRARYYWVLARKSAAQTRKDFSGLLRQVEARLASVAQK